ncbi:MAG: putative acyl-CoA ligase [Ramlibacter sp.]|nr:putative acyl-CoA ligase [Ramlibacter sp.]
MESVQVGQGLDSLFQPRSIAIFGASDDVTKIGGRPLQFLLKFGYAGRIFPVNRKAGLVQGQQAYANVVALPETPELAVIAVPPEGVLEVIQDCAGRGVRAAVILSAGFSEMGEAGSRLQAEIGAVARSSGMRVVGPNCLGSIGIADKAIATFSVALESGLPEAGNVGIVSQSGNLGSYTMRLAADRGMGISRFLTTGNECDVDIADAIASLAKDPATSVILCCMETCRDGAKLVQAMQMAREAGKPLVVLKVGVSEAGSAAAASHTGALAGSDAVFDVVLRNGGAIRVPSIEQLLDVGHAFAVVGAQRAPKGNRVAVLTASGGFGVLLADAATAQGLALPNLAAQTQERVLSVVPFASPANPVDMTAQVSSRPEVLVQVLSAVAADPSCDALILQSANAFNLPRLRDVFLAALEQVRREHPSRLILLCCRAPRDVVAQLNRMGYPTVEGIDAACATLAALVRLGTRSRHSLLPPLREGQGGGTPLPESAFADEASAKAALAAAGLPVLREVTATSRDAALAAARAIGFPLVLKIVSPDIAHKTEVGGVFVGVRSAEQLLTEYDALLARVAQKAPQARLTGVLVAQMAQGGTELILGTKKDPVFGTVVMVGLGGIFAEIMRDVALQIAPVTEQQATAMLKSLKAFALLDGARGRPRADVAAAARAVASLSRFAALHADTVAEIDINPLVVLDEGRGAFALDALLVRETKGKQ